MTGFWNWLWGSMSAGQPELRAKAMLPTPVETPPLMNYPKTFQQFATDIRLDHLEIFDPALKQYGCAFRNGEPMFPHAEVAQIWLESRRTAMDHLLRLIAQSGYGPDLVLRGSRVLKEWFGEKAREPGDLDWVVRSKRIKPSDAWWTNFVDSIQRIIRDQGSVGSVQLLGSQIALDEIWTYERLPGRRIVVPWTTDTSLQGAIQMDFAFEEELWVDPITISFVTKGGRAFNVVAASKELSLAWKILWLETDSYPQGKDLYDAVLLAEQVQLPFQLLKQVLLSSPECRREINAAMPLTWDAEWHDFKREYPWVEGKCEEWKERLWKALLPTFQTVEADLYDGMVQDAAGRGLPLDEAFNEVRTQLGLKND